MEDGAGATTTAQSPAQIRIMGFFLLILAAFMVYFVVAFWPLEKADGKGWADGVALFGWDFRVSHDMRLLWLVVITSSLGSFVHTATSFATYVGNQKLKPSWYWWYILRIPIGIALALIFYCLIRGGLFSGGSLSSDISPYGVAGLSGLVGMFSKQASDKLREIFDNLFRTTEGAGDAERHDKLDAKPARLSAIEPGSVAVGAAAVITLRGSHFAQDSTVLVNGNARATEFRSPTELAFQLAAEDVAAAGTLRISVKRRGQEAVSNELALEVR